MRYLPKSENKSSSSPQKIDNKKRAAVLATLFLSLNSLQSTYNELTYLYDKVLTNFVNFDLLFDAFFL